MARPSKRKRNAGNQPKSNKPAAQAAKKVDEPTTIPSVPFAIGLACLLVAAGATLVLVLQHFGGMDAPGCGVGSPCAAAQSSVYGKVPGLGWPVSHVGLSYFLAMIFGWLMLKSRGVAPAFRNLARLGAVASLVYIVIILIHIKEYFCPYCLTAHIANFGFLACVEIAAKSALRTAVKTGILTFVALAFVVTTAAMIPIEIAVQERVRKEAEADLDMTTDLAINAPPSQRQTFTGRWRIGPERAKLRIVTFTDFQCPDCYAVEQELKTLLETRDDISLSAKHFPMDAKCNTFMGGRTLHANACWAARASEAAGLLRGQDGFWDMYFWLFERNGSFTDAELNEHLRAEGYDVQEFIDTMTSDDTLTPVENDIAEAMRLGLKWTPMVFINGVQIKGGHLAGNFTRAVNRISASNPPAMSVAEAGGDVPMTGIERIVDEFRNATALNMPADTNEWAFTSGSAGETPIEVVLWGDYQEEFTREADRIIRARVGQDARVVYKYRHYPFDKSCNANLQVETRHPLACLAAKAAEAAGRLGGNDAYWKMHKWLVDNPNSVSPDTVAAAASSFGLDAAAYRAELNAQAVEAAIQEDITAGRRVAITAIPWVFINGKRIDRTRMQGRSTLQNFLDAALQDLN